MTETIFTKIINREIPATIVYEDDTFLAFLDINPVTKGHTLLISKAQYEWIHEMPDELIGEAFIKATTIIKNMRKRLPCDYVQVTVVGKDVPHFHIHLIPRYFNDTLPEFPRITYDSNEEKELVASKIRI